MDTVINDIDRVSKIARAMVTEYGMSDKVGTLSFGEDDEVFLGKDFSKSKSFSEKMGELIDSEVKLLADNAYIRAEEILKENIDKLHDVAKYLLEFEKLEADEFGEIYTTGTVTKRSYENNDEIKSDHKKEEKNINEEKNTEKNDFIDEDELVTE